MMHDTAEHRSTGGKSKSVSQVHRIPSREQPNAGQRNDVAMWLCAHEVESLENHAAGGFPLVEGQQRRSGGGLEDIVHALARQG